MKVAFYRNSRAEVFCKKGVLRNFVKVAVAASGNTKPGRFLLISVFFYIHLMIWRQNLRTLTFIFRKVF